MLRYTIFALALLAGINVCLCAVIPDPSLQDALKLTNEQPAEVLSRQQRAADGFGDFGGHGHGGHHGGYGGHHGGYGGHHGGFGGGYYPGGYGGYGGYGHHHHHSPYYGGGYYGGYPDYGYGYGGYQPGFGIYFG